jgi:sterol desaturase/sphingolipid hydroxylase (fatty acid hydroxylase superfamily)
MRPLVIGCLAALALLLFALEQIHPLRERTRGLIGHLLVNVVVSALAFVVAALLIRPLVEGVLRWSSEAPFGVVHLVGLPGIPRAALAFLLMDLSFYYWHLANHRVPFLWRFHNVHHIDPDLDVSTALRFHFGEIAMSAAFRALQLTTIGTSPVTYVIYESTFQANTLFHHSNVRLPIALERLLNKVLVTPRMHGIHHSQVRAENNSNYSVVLSCWDRLHRSLRLNIPQSELVIGIPAYRAPDDNRLWNVLVLPFRKQRDYWRGTDGTYVERDQSALGGDLNRLES